MDSSRYLVVEDSKFFNSIVSKAVGERVGAEVVSTLSLAEAIKAVTESELRFSLAVVDLVLPDAPNGEAVSWLQDQGIPCIVFTGVFSEDLRERLLAEHVLDYVVKETPSSLSYLVDLVGRLHRNRNIKVLVVDDSRTARGYAADLLKSYQFQVFEAESGEAGLGFLADNPDIRLVITDYNMPGMDGVEMVKRMRATHDQDRLAIIGVSSGGGNALSARFIKFGANDFINKPYLREEFFCRVMQNIRMLDMVERLTDMATKDALTGIHNRRFFFEAGETLFARAKRDQVALTAAMLDIDFFKKVNDTYGHDGGDAILKRVASLLRSLCRQTDVVARFGGEEFAILAVSMDDCALHPFFEKLRASLEAEEIIHAGHRIPVTASFGVCHGIGTSLESMLKTADEMLYQAKQNGRNRVEVA
ncbi:Response regulator receiver modulated diguanylate cyclase [Rhodospirillaceae bacterium LM-1]|nr:Response regulator receiver modulated diguanylate cyclase [Rhodospirillaceae bacterium LM-1]